MISPTRLVLVVVVLAGPATAQDYPKLAPYPAIRWTPKDTPEVTIDGQWYALRAIDGTATETIVEFAKKTYGDRWQKRFNEDLVQVLSEMKKPPGKAVKLTLRDLKTDAEKTLADVLLTAENRRAIVTGGRPAAPGPAAVPVVTADGLRKALDEFQTALDDRWAYRDANKADFPAAIQALRKKIDAGLTRDEFGLELQKIIALGIDGHAGVSGFSLPAAGRSPFLVQPAGDRFVAFKPDRSGFLADGFPYLTKIEDRAVADWIGAAAALVPKGSPQYVGAHAVRGLRDVESLRRQLKAPGRVTVEVELTTADGSAGKRVALPVGNFSSTFGEWPRGKSRRLDGDIGYLRLARMDEAAVREIREWMSKFRDTAGLVVDVRDNGGGIRDPMRLLYSYLAAPDAPPRVFTAAAYRLHPSRKPTHLAPRFMYPADAKEWTDAERKAVAVFAATFKPEWPLPDGQFSPWHYMALSRSDEAGVYHYQEPVVVLSNAWCFSATDIFLAGLKGMPGVTLLGTPSGGGSALAERIDLGATGLRVRLASMASFQADGKLFDGVGVQPDVVVEPVPEYFIGGRDNLLDEAVKRIGRK